jgi:hypothetical protein
LCLEEGGVGDFVINGDTVTERLADPPFAAAENNFRRAVVISHKLLTFSQPDLQFVSGV